MKLQTAVQLYHQLLPIPNKPYELDQAIDNLAKYIAQTIKEETTQEKRNKDKDDRDEIPF